MAKRIHYVNGLLSNLDLNRSRSLTHSLETTLAVYLRCLYYLGHHRHSMTFLFIALLYAYCNCVSDNLELHAVLVEHCVYPVNDWFKVVCCSSFSFSARAQECIWR